MNAFCIIYNNEFSCTLGLNAYPDVYRFVNKNIKWHRLAIFMSLVVNIMDKRRKIKNIFNEIEIFMFLILN